MLEGRVDELIPVEEPERLLDLIRRHGPGVLIFRPAILRDNPEVIGRARRMGVGTIALLTEEEAGRINRVESDDFILIDPSKSPPCSPVELILRIRSLLKEEDSIRIGDLEIIPSRYEVRVKGRRVVLTLKEYELLKFLATHPERVFTREFLLSEIWGYDYFGGTRTVDVHIGRLRSKLDMERPIIKTVRGVGYMLTLEEDEGGSRR
ncbi:hypothetical protein DRP77_03510 [Candidatus Poribacteria bacterium]|nr:MAG: hypothetical protein DRP77_03510 [Candidatus Poribacteria bacterium]